MVTIFDALEKLPLVIQMPLAVFAIFSAFAFFLFAMDEVTRGQRFLMLLLFPLTYPIFMLYIVTKIIRSSIDLTIEGVRDTLQMIKKKPEQLPSVDASIQEAEQELERFLKESESK